MNNCFLPTDILLPRNVRLENWAVIACDQFTSDRAYWDRVEKLAENVPSTYHMVFPEIDLENNPAQRIENIAQAMKQYLTNDLFSEYKNAYIYVERTLLDGSVRPGIVGMIDLEQYHYDPAQKPSVGATEQTILSRVPPRIAVRREAELEFPHAILFCNDSSNLIVEPIQKIKDRLPKIYDFMLMEGGGHISGWLIAGTVMEKLQNALQKYFDNAQGAALLVADGNHSLVTAKCWYDELKKLLPDSDLSAHPARYAMVELENILDPSVVFEPINRVIFDTNPEQLLQDMEQISTPSGVPIHWYYGDMSGVVRLNVPRGELPVAVFQKFLDSWLDKNPGRVDYIHDLDAVIRFSGQDNAVGFVLPTFDKAELFAFGASGKILPRKTFSLGHSREKRYYLEGRKIR